jgi:hypothetical protein
LTADEWKQTYGALKYCEPGRKLPGFGPTDRQFWVEGMPFCRPTHAATPSDAGYRIKGIAYSRLQPVALQLVPAGNPVDMHAKPLEAWGLPTPELQDNGRVETSANEPRTVTFERTELGESPKEGTLLQVAFEADNDQPNRLGSVRILVYSNTWPEITKLLQHTSSTADQTPKLKLKSQAETNSKLRRQPAGDDNTRRDPSTSVHRAELNVQSPDGGTNSVRNLFQDNNITRTPTQTSDRPDCDFVWQRDEYLLCAAVEPNIPESHAVLETIAAMRPVPACHDTRTDKRGSFRWQRHPGDAGTRVEWDGDADACLVDSYSGWAAAPSADSIPNDTKSPVHIDLKMEFD